MLLTQNWNHINWIFLTQHLQFFDSLRSHVSLKSSRAMLRGMHFRQDEGLKRVYVSTCVYKCILVFHKTYNINEDICHHMSVYIHIAACTSISPIQKETSIPVLQLRLASFRQEGVEHFKKHLIQRVGSPRWPPRSDWGFQTRWIGPNPWSNIGIIKP